MCLFEAQRCMHCIKGISFHGAALHMRSVFCCLGSWGWVNEALLGLFRVKGSSDNSDIVLFLNTSPCVNKHSITQLGKHTHTDTHTGKGLTNGGHTNETCINWKNPVLKRNITFEYISLMIDCAVTSFLGGREKTVVNMHAATNVILVNAM